MSDPLPPRRIAGHMMVETPHGAACRDCGRTWIEMVQNRDRWKVGEKDIAHYLALNAYEVEQLFAEEERIYRSMFA